jgi:tetratricopeptide (TPR) repeat protein
MSDVFISYSKTERELAEKLAVDLKSRGISVWWDFELYTGEDFHETIIAALDAAKAVVVIWSDAAVASRWVRGEAEHAADANKLIPLCVTGFDKRRLPLNFRALHTDDVSADARLMRALGRLDVFPHDKIACENTLVEECLRSAEEHVDNGDYNYAIAHERALKIAQYYELASIAMDTGKNEEAIAHVSKATALDTTDASGYVYRGMLFARDGKYDKAIADVNEAIKIAPKPSHYHARGRYAEAAGQVVSAMEDYTKAIELGAYEPAFVDRGRLHELNGNEGLARADYLKAAELKEVTPMRSVARKSLDALWGKHKEGQ